MQPNGWIEHRRGDGELVGWMVPDGELFAVMDLLGRRLGDAVEWLDAEELLDELGIGYLADPFALAVDGQTLRVRLTEVSTERIRVKKDDFGAIDVPLVEFTLEWPMPATLRPMTADEVRHGVPDFIGRVDPAGGAADDASDVEREGG